MAELKEQTMRIGTLTRILQRAEIIDENEEIVLIEFDINTNQVTLYLKPLTK